ncbi:hypothetical protein D3C74_159580 [compost metagenome]
MPELEREVITRRYLSVNANYTSHQEIYRGMGISSPFYTKIRRSAIGKIAAEFGTLS